MGTNLKKLGWVLCLPVLGASIGRAEDGRWEQAAAMQEARRYHTVTRLPKGQILVTGGYHDEQISAQCEIYDPEIGRWRFTAPLPEKKAWHQAVRLKDGHILVLGWGVHCFVFDPTSETWTETGSLLSDRLSQLGLQAVELSDGRVLAIGGTWGTPTTCEIYDPVSGVWSAGPPLLRVHSSGFTATALSDGRVLVVGGWDSSRREGTGDCEIYDPATNQWSRTTAMAIPRYGHADTLLEDGRVLISGGLSKEQQGSPPQWVYLSQTSCEIYDPRAGTWSAAAPLSEARHSHDIAKLQNGHVIAVGGEKRSWVDRDGGGGYYESEILASAERFDPAFNAWSPAGTMAAARLDFKLVHLRDGRLLVAEGGLYDERCELFVPLSWGGISPNKVEVKKGFYFAGSKHELEKSDGEGDAGYYIATSAWHGQREEHPATILEFTAKLQRTTERRLQVYVEARSDNLGTEMKVSLYDYGGREKFIDFGFPVIIGPTDKVFEFDVLVEDGSFIGPDGQVRLRLKHAWPGEEGRGREIHTFVDRVTFKLCE